MRRAVWSFAAVVMFAAPAWAEPAAPAGDPALGERAGVALSLERLFGVDHVYAWTASNGATTQETTSTSISVFTQGRYAVYEIPRLAADLFVRRGLSLGTAFSLGSGSQTVTQYPPGSSTTASLTDVLVAPRVGYLAQLGRRWSIWPRAGVTFQFGWGDTPGAPGYEFSTREYVLLGTMDVPVVFTVVPRVAFTLAPTFDLTLVHQIRLNTGIPAANLYTAGGFELGLQAGLIFLL